VTGGDLVVEGTFAGNPAYCQSLGALRSNQRVLAEVDAAGTARGAAMLAQWPPPYRVAAPAPVPAVAVPGLQAYRDAWTASLGDASPSQGEEIVNEVVPPGGVRTSSETLPGRREGRC